MKTWRNFKCISLSERCACCLCVCEVASVVSDSLQPCGLQPSRFSALGTPGKDNWSGLLFPPPEDLPDSGTEPASHISPALAGGLFTASATWEAQTHERYKSEKGTCCMIVTFWKRQKNQGNSKMTSDYKGLGGGRKDEQVETEFWGAVKLFCLI